MISVLLTSWKGLGLPRQLPNPIGGLRDSPSQIWEIAPPGCKVELLEARRPPSVFPGEPN